MSVSSYLASFSLSVASSYGIYKHYKQQKEHEKQYYGLTPSPSKKGGYIPSVPSVSLDRRSSIAETLRATELLVSSPVHISQYFPQKKNSLQNPMRCRGQRRTVQGGEGYLKDKDFVGDQEFITTRRHFISLDQLGDLDHTYLFHKAGPRIRLPFKPLTLKAAIVTCGGITPGINVLIREIVMCLWFNYGCKSVSGVLGGFQGFYQKNYISLSPQLVKDIHQSGGSILKCSDTNLDVQKVADAIQTEEYQFVFFIGGHTILQAMDSIQAELNNRKYVAILCAIPKAIDNDFPLLDRTFGFNTAIEEVDRAIDVANIEAENQSKTVGLVKVMGKNSGFITMYASLANRNVNICLIPEAPYALDGEHGVLSHIKRRLEKRDHCVMVISEGAGQACIDRKHMASHKDPANPVNSQDIGTFLKQEIKGLDTQVKVKSIDPTNMIRAVAASASDSVLCTCLAQNAVHGAMAGYTQFSVGLIGGQYVYLPNHILTARGQQNVDVKGEMYLRLIESTGQPSFVP